MSECEGLSGDELQECQEDRARRKQYVDKIGNRLIDHAFDSMSKTGSAGEAASLAGRAAGTVGESAASGVGALLEALPAAALALATGGHVDSVKARNFAKARAELEAIHERLKKSHVGAVSGAQHVGHAGRARRRSS
jgi:hypothetical protein